MGPLVVNGKCVKVPHGTPLRVGVVWDTPTDPLPSVPRSTRPTPTAVTGRPDVSPGEDLAQKWWMFEYVCVVCHLKQSSFHPQRTAGHVCASLGTGVGVLGWSAAPLPLRTHHPDDWDPV